MIKNMVGLEAEMFAFDKNDAPAILNYNMPHDGVPILAEIRGDPADKWERACGNFVTAMYELYECAIKSEVTLRSYSSLLVEDTKLRKQIKKYTVKSGNPVNLYGDQEEISSLVTDENNRVIGKNFYAGLHIHFSTESILSVRDSSGSTTVHNENIMTYPVLKAIIEDMDDFYKKNFTVNYKASFRQPGWYEIKPYGFEYRSLPYSDETFAYLPEIAKYAFETLNKHTKGL